MAMWNPDAHLQILADAAAPVDKDALKAASSVIHLVAF